MLLISDQISIHSKTQPLALFVPATLQSFVHLPKYHHLFRLLASNVYHSLVHMVVHRGTQCATRGTYSEHRSAGFTERFLQQVVRLYCYLPRLFQVCSTLLLRSTDSEVEVRSVNFNNFYKPMDFRTKIRRIVETFPILHHSNSSIYLLDSI